MSNGQLSFSVGAATSQYYFLHTALMNHRQYSKNRKIVQKQMWVWAVAWLPQGLKLTLFENCSSVHRLVSGPLRWKKYQKMLISAFQATSADVISQSCTFLEFSALCEHWLRLGADEVLLTLCAKINNLCKINCPENTTEKTINFKIVY